MRTIRFDLDGTLIDPGDGITRSIQHALKTQYALKTLDFPCPAADALTWCIGPPLLASCETLIGNPADAERALRHYRERYSENRSRAIGCCTVMAVTGN